MSEDNDFSNINLNYNNYNLQNDIEGQLSDLDKIRRNLQVRRDNNNLESCCPICIYYFLILLLMIILIGGLISYYVFGILFLVKYYDKFSECSQSHLWEYVLTSLVLSLINSKLYNSNDNKNNVSFINLILIFLINLGLNIWGGIEIFFKLCNDLDNTSLTKFALAVFSLQTICTFISLTIPCCICYFEKSENNN